MSTRHPIQPLVFDERGTLRFKANAIVRHLLDHGGIDMNDISRMDFSREDREQFAQLIGYSHSGAGNLGYMSDDVLDLALSAHEERGHEAESRESALRDKMDGLRAALREPMAELFGVHPDDLFIPPTTEGGHG